MSQFDTALDALIAAATALPAKSASRVEFERAAVIRAHHAEVDAAYRRGVADTEAVDAVAEINDRLYNCAEYPPTSRN